MTDSILFWLVKVTLYYQEAVVFFASFFAGVILIIGLSFDEDSEVRAPIVLAAIAAGLSGPVSWIFLAWALKRFDIKESLEWMTIPTLAVLFMTGAMVTLALMRKMTPAIDIMKNKFTVSTRLERNKN